jgi:hypothetical protein
VDERLGPLENVNLHHLTIDLVRKRYTQTLNKWLILLKKNVKLNHWESDWARYRTKMYCGSYEVRTDVA